jgi:hypothetical protein
MTWAAAQLFLKGGLGFVLKHWRAFALLGFAIAIGIALEVAHSRGYAAGKADCEAAQAKAQAAADTRAKAADAEFQRDSANAKGFYNGIGDELIPLLARPEYRIACFDPIGMRLVNEALAGPSGRSRAAVPGSDATHR